MSRRRPPSTHGLAVIDKPVGVTSHDVVGIVRRRFAERQVGHAGTLDPDATGVLLVGVGRVTRLLRFLTDLGKTYTAEVVFGSTTDTLDASGTVTGSFDMTGLDIARVRAAAQQLTGDIEQVPPMVSALKVGGRRLHELAREGVTVDRVARPVRVERFVIETTTDPMVMSIEVQCSKGTYIRSLADDLGRLCGGGAHVRALRRTAVGSFTVAEARPPDEAALLSPAEALRDLARVEVADEVAARVCRGAVLDAAEGFDGAGPWAVVDLRGELLAVYEPFGGGRAKPAVVVA